MGIIQRQSIKSSLSGLIGIVLGYVNTIVLFPALLEPWQIGVYRVLERSALMVASIVILGTPRVISRYYPYFVEDRERSAFKGMTWLNMVFGYFLFIGLYLLFGQTLFGYYLKQAPELSDYLFLIFPLVFSIAVFLIGMTHAATTLRIVIPNLLRDVVNKVFVFIALVCLFFGAFDWDIVLYTYVGAYLFSAVILWIYQYRRDPIKLTSPRPIWNSPIFKQISRFQSVAMLNSIANSVVNYIDTILVGMLLNLSSAGIYSIAWFLGAVVEVPRRSLNQIASPLISKALKNNDTAQLQTIYSKAALNQMLIAGLFFVTIILNLDSIYGIIPNGDTYKAGSQVVFWIGLAKWLDLSFGVNGEIIANSKKNYFNLFSTLLLAGLTVASNLYLIPKFGMEGAAMATTLSLLIYNLAKMTFLKIDMGIQPFGTKSLVVLLIIATVGFVGYITPSLKNPWFDLALRGLAMGLASLLLIWKLKPSEDIHSMVSNFMERGWKSLFNK